MTSAMRNTRRARSVGCQLEAAGSSGSSVFFGFRARQQGRQWLEDHKLFPLDPDLGDWFGWTLDASGDRLAVSAFGDDDNGPVSGAVYIFRRQEPEWVQEAKLVPAGVPSYRKFGGVLDLEGDLLVAAETNLQNTNSEGTVYVFRFSGRKWIEEQTLQPDDLESFVFFGSGISIDPGTISIGAPHRFSDGSSGGVYVFRHDGIQWTVAEKLPPPASSSDFGKNLSLDGDGLVVFGDGSGWLFRFNGAAWTLERTFTPTDDTIWGDLAYSRSLEILLGGQTESLAPGKVYSFVTTGGDLDADGVLDFCDNGDCAVAVPDLLTLLANWG